MRRVPVPQCALVVARVKLLPLEPCSARAGCAERGPGSLDHGASWASVPAGSDTGAHWEGSGSFLPQQQQLGSRWGREPPLRQFMHCPWMHPQWAHRLCLCIPEELIPGIDTAAVTAVCDQESLLLHPAVHTRGCFFSEPNSLYFIVCCCEFLIKVFKAVSCVVLCENPPLFSLRCGRWWRTEGEDFACGCVALQVNGSKKAGSGGRGDERQPWACSLGWDRITFPLITCPFSENGGKKVLGHWL